MIYVISFLVSLFLAFLATFLVKKIAERFKIFDWPDGGERKIQKAPVPYLGGVGIYAAFATVVIFLILFSDQLVGHNISVKKLVAILVAGLLIMIGGVLDDKYNLKPKYQIIFPVLAILAVILGGVGVKEITNPFGGLIKLNTWQWNLFWHDGVPYRFTLAADIFTFVWLIGMMYTTKLLDGLDGLVSGLSVIGGLIIFMLSTATRWFQPDTALLAVVFAGACLGFLAWNFNPAKIYLGEGGSLFAGFMLGVLSIIAGGKIATALLIMGLPILDVVWVIIRRRFFEHKNPFKTADRKHLHFRLIDAGLSQKQAVVFYYCAALIFGSLTLFLQSRDKLLALGILVILMIIISSIVVYFNSRRART